MPISTWYENNDPNLSLFLLSSHRLPPLLLGFHFSSHPLPPHLPPILPISWLTNNNKSPSLLILLHLSPSSTYPIKTLSNSHQQTTFPRSFILKLSSSATTSITLINDSHPCPSATTGSVVQNAPNPDFLP